MFHVKDAKAAKIEASMTHRPYTSSKKPMLWEIWNGSVLWHMTESGSPCQSTHENQGELCPPSRVLYPLDASLVQPFDGRKAKLSHCIYACTDAGHANGENEIGPLPHEPAERDEGVCSRHHRQHVQEAEQRHCVSKSGRWRKHRSSSQERRDQRREGCHQYDTTRHPCPVRESVQYEGSDTSGKGDSFLRGMSVYEQAENHCREDESRKGMQGWTFDRVASPGPSDDGASVHCKCLNHVDERTESSSDGQPLPACRTHRCNRLVFDFHDRRRGMKLQRSRGVLVEGQAGEDEAGNVPSSRGRIGCCPEWVGRSIHVFEKYGNDQAETEDCSLAPFPGLTTHSRLPHTSPDFLADASNSRKVPTIPSMYQQRWTRAEQLVTG